jgi:molybdenum cofactor synthesis domain-containing protein
VIFEVSGAPLEPRRVLAAVAHPGAGAVDVFHGLVRAEDAGMLVTRLDYEAYAPMAVREMRRVAEQIEQRYPGTRLACVHRVGSLAVGELAIVTAASAPHRAEAFAANRELVDGIKATVPIWKRQHGPHGPYWVGWRDARCSGEHGGAHAAGSENPPRDSDAHAQHSRTHSCRSKTTPHRGAVDERSVRVGVLTVSDTRTRATDASGDVIEEALCRAGHELVSRELVRDEPEQIAERIQLMLGQVEALVTTGGTGIAPRDSTYEVVTRLLEKRLDGFGEAFRRLSWDAIGPLAVLSRAVGGTCRGRLLFALPGSPSAAELGTRELVLPLVGHARELLGS